MTRRVIIIIFVMLFAVVAASGCIGGESATYVISTTTVISQTNTITSSYTLTESISKTVYTTETITLTTLLTDTNSHITTETTTITKIENSAAVVVYYSIIRVPVDFDGKPNIVVYSPITDFIIYDTGTSTFTVYYWTGLGMDPYVLQLFSYIDGLYYSENSFSNVMKMNSSELIRYVHSAILLSPDLIDDPTSYILSKKIPVNIYYDIFALNALFNEDNLEYFYLDTGVAIVTGNYVVYSNELYGNSDAFFMHYFGTMMTIVSFKNGVPYATISFSPASMPQPVSTFFPTKCSFVGEYSNSNATTFVTGYRTNTTWRMSVTIISTTQTIIHRIVYRDGSLIIDKSTTPYKYELFIQKIAPVFLRSMNVYYIDSSMAVITTGDEFYTLKNSEIEGYYTGDYTVITSEILS